MPLHFQKYFLYYDTMQAGETSMVRLVAKWTFFWILQENACIICDRISNKPFLHAIEAAQHSVPGSRPLDRIIYIIPGVYHTRLHGRPSMIQSTVSYLQ